MTPRVVSEPGLICCPSRACPARIWGAGGSGRKLSAREVSKRLRVFPRFGTAEALSPFSSRCGRNCLGRMAVVCLPGTCGAHLGQPSGASKGRSSTWSAEYTEGKKKAGPTHCEWFSLAHAPRPVSTLIFPNFCIAPYCILVQGRDTCSSSYASARLPPS